jgi:hypothetical protein
MEPRPAAHVAQGGSRSCGSPRRRQGAVGQSRAPPDAATPHTPFPGGSRAATGGGQARARRGRGCAAPPLCPPAPLPAQPRGAGAPRPRCPSHAARGLSPEQSAAARSRRHVPRPHPRAARPTGTWRRGRRSRRAGQLLPRRAPGDTASEGGSTPPATRAPGCPPRAAAGEVGSPARELPTRVNKAHAERGRRQAARPGAPAPLRPPSRAQSLGAPGSRPRHATPPAGAQVPRGRAPSRPAACPMCGRRRRRFVLQAL